MPSLLVTSLVNVMEVPGRVIVDVYLEIMMVMIVMTVLANPMVII